MNDQLYTMLDQLAAKLGVAVEMIWKASMRNVIIGGYIDIAVSILLFLVSGGCLGVLLACTKNDDWDYALGDGKIVLVIVGIIGIIFTVGFFVSGLMGLLAPEYYAFKNIFDYIRP